MARIYLPDSHVSTREETLRRVFLEEEKNEPGSAQKGDRDGLDSPTWPTRSSSDFGRGKEVIAFYQRSQTSSALTPATHLVSQTGCSHPGRQPRTETTANHNNPHLPSASINPPFPNHLSSNIFRKRRKNELETILINLKRGLKQRR